MEVIEWAASVCLFVCLFVNRIRRKVLKRFSWNVFRILWTTAVGRIDQILWLIPLRTATIIRTIGTARCVCVSSILWRHLANVAENYCHRQSLDGATVLHIVHNIGVGMRSTEWLPLVTFLLINNKCVYLWTDRQTDTQTDATERITTPCSQVVNIGDRESMPVFWHNSACTVWT